MPSVYNNQYVCVELDSSNTFKSWQQAHSGGYITPQMAGQIIMFALVINVIVFGLKSIKRVF